MNLLEKIHRHGLKGSVHKMLLHAQHISGWTAWYHRDTPCYQNPTPHELKIIEQDLAALGVIIDDYAPSSETFWKFQKENWFPVDYHGGINGEVWDEKLLEHWISSERLALMSYRRKDIYVDIAAASSPWVQMLRERKKLNSFAIDLSEVGKTYQHLSYYRVENATKTTFADASVKGASLHCAYEMFMGEDDTQFIYEVARILKPGGKVIILPLYMHTHYCAYSTSEYYGKGFSDPEAKEYIRLDCNGIPSSRKYDAERLKSRVLDPIEKLGMQYNLLVLRNKAEFGKNIYCHFILEISR